MASTMKPSNSALTSRTRFSCAWIFNISTSPFAAYFLTVITWSCIEFPRLSRPVLFWCACVWSILSSFVETFLLGDELLGVLPEVFVTWVIDAYSPSLSVIDGLVSDSSSLATSASGTWCISSMVALCFVVRMLSSGLLVVGVALLRLKLL